MFRQTFMRRTCTLTLLSLTLLPVGAAQRPAARGDIDRQFDSTVRPFLAAYCTGCHSGPKAMAQLDLQRFTTVASIVEDHPHWSTVLQKLSAGQMPPSGAKQPAAAERDRVVTWVDTLLKQEARKNAGDPGIVLARRLSNAEFNYTIRDLTGADIRPAREFPVDPANPAGFDNSGESLAMSPALLDKYLQAAREIANHMVLKPSGIAFAPHLVLADTDRDKYCVKNIIDFYKRQPTDYAEYFRAAWAFRHRAALGGPARTLTTVAREYRVSPKYLATVWRTLEETKEEVGPLAKLQTMWRDLPAPGRGQREVARAGCERMRDYVVSVRRKIELRHTTLSVPGIRGTAQPFLMWRNRAYATNRTNFDRSALQVEGEARPSPLTTARSRGPADNEDEESASRPPAQPPTPDPDLQAPAGQRARYEAAFARFSAVFPDAFYVSERGRYFPDNTRDTGRHLSAGFHNLMGYFRDDLPLYDMILDASGQKELDELWRELDFVASANIRTYVQFYLNESGEARTPSADAAAAAAEDRAITSEARIHRVATNYLAKAKASGNEMAIRAIQEHFDSVNAGIRWVEKARLEAEPRHLEALLKFAARAYRRPLKPAEREDLLGYYRSLRDKDGLSHEDAMRDSLVSILMAPDFGYRIDLVEAGGGAVRKSIGPASALPLSDYALASRLSYFLWSSMPDDELLAHAAAGDLRNPSVLVAQARRMLKDSRARAFATEFAGNWLDFRRFEEHNAVDRERFPSFDNELRQSMFEEPIRFFEDIIRNDRSVLESIYGNHTFVNRALAKHYGISDIDLPAGEWARVDDGRRYGRGGLLPMAVFLTKYAPGLRTSPVKRGYWVVKRVLGEEIPPPPPVVPELPRDEAKSELPLRELLAKHRENAACASCHARFDSFGLALESYGPVGEKRSVDLAGRPVDSRAEFPGGVQASGLDGLRDYIRSRREKDFVDNISRKVLAYALGRSLMLSDEPLIEAMRARMAANGYRFSTLVTSVVTSPQFLTKRAQRPTSEVRRGD